MERHGKVAEFFEALKHLKWIIGITGIALLLVTFGSVSDFYLVLGINLLMVALLLVARNLAARDLAAGEEKHTNLGWGLVGLVILFISVLSWVSLEQFKADAPSVNAFLQTLTLIWAPIGSGIIVGPIMKVRPRE